MVIYVVSAAKALAGYIDPAATNILVVSLTSVAVAAGAVFIILWRKFKKGVKKAFHIDENAGKEVEEDLVILDDESSETEPRKEAEENPESAEKAEEAEPAREETADTETKE